MKAARPIVGLIPARAGSRGVTGKNWRELGGRTLVERAIDSAQQTGLLDAIILSSDHPNAAPLSSRLGVTFIPRSAHAAGDAATAADVVRDCLPRIDHRLAEADPWIVYLQPTSAFRAAHHITEALALLDDERVQGVVSVVESDHTPYKAVLVTNGAIQPVFSDDLMGANRQTLPVTYRANGAIYVFRMSEFERFGEIPVSGATPFVMSRDDSLDIDTPADWAAAELRLSHGS